MTQRGEHTTRLTPDRPARSVAAAGFIAALFAWQAWVIDYRVDDSFISFRYAKHLVEGHGLVYNIGERIEGYTNFMWVILLAGASWMFPAASMPSLAGMLGVAAALLTIAAVARGLVLLGRTRTEGLVAALLLAVHAGFVAWSTAGLETVLFAGLLFAGTLSVARHAQGRSGVWWMSVCFGAAALTRADGVIFAGVGLGLVCLVQWRRGGWRGLYLPALLAGVIAAMYVPYLLWRWSYYGGLLPNTAYVKAGGDPMQVARGLGYVWSYVAEYGVLGWLPAVAALLSLTASAWSWVFVSMIAFNLLYVVYLGGDSLGFHRFIVHVAPLICAVQAAALADLYRRWLAPIAVPAVRLTAAAATLATLAVLSGQSAWTTVLVPDLARWREPQSELSFPGDGATHGYRWFGNYFVERLAVAARYLDAHAPAGSVIASTPAGSIAYHMNHRVIDMLGLTDSHIARSPGLFRGDWARGWAGHEKGDGLYVLSREPDYILMGNVAVLRFPLDKDSMSKKLVFKSEHEIWAAPEFHRRYELVSVRLADSGPFQYFSFYRRRG